MKKRGDKTPLPAAMELLSRNYKRILLEVGDTARSVGFLELQDAIQETAILMTSDPAVSDVDSDEEFVRLFIYRLRMIRFRVKQDYANEKKRLNHADYLSTEEEEWY